MYSKKSNYAERERSVSFTPPPGYDGSRFRRRSDGRDDTFPLYDEPLLNRPEPFAESISDTESCPCRCDDCNDSSRPALGDDTCKCREDDKKQSAASLIAPILRNIGKEELILIALIIILAGEKDCIDTDTILLLALLLCAG